jgi:hypothetical protein
MAAWWKRWQVNKSAQQEAALMLRDYGERAYQLAIQRARKARNERNPRRARHYAAVAWHVENGGGATQSDIAKEGQTKKTTSNAMPACVEG